MPAPAPLRALKIATVVMGVAIVLGTIVVVTVIVRRASGDFGGAGDAGMTTANVLLDEPEGTAVVGVAGWTDRLAVTLHGGGADRIVVVDTRSGRVVQRLRLEH